MSRKTNLQNSLLFTLTVSSASLCYGGTVDSHSFNGVTNGAIDTTGTLDWGYISSNDNKGLFSVTYNKVDFDAITSALPADIATAKTDATIGSVTLTEGTGTGSDKVRGDGNVGNKFTFDGNQAFGSYGQFKANAQNVWTLTFNDLGIGTFAITLYMGHTATDRKFDMDYSLIDGSTISGTTTMTGTINDLGSTVVAEDLESGPRGWSFTYDIEVTTVTASADLSLIFSSISGGIGEANLSGYTVTAVPEPSAFALVSGLLCLTSIALRRNL